MPKSYYQGYTRIKIKEKGKRAYWWRLQVIKEDSVFLIGERVNTKGDCVDVKVDEQHIQIIQKSLIVERQVLEFNPKYALLEIV